MEVELKSVAGIESCFVSLPLFFITTLESTCAGVIPPFLALQLRFPDNRIRHVAWTGSASSSSAIEVGQHFADCLEVYHHTIVKVRAVCNLSEARQIVVEPDTADDWEVMELNSERAETSLLSQVGIVSEGMKFPLWLSGGAVARFIVVSISPQKSVVRLVPGTEVVVAPKKRTRNTHSDMDSSVKVYKKDKIGLMAQLRVQEDSTRVLTHTCKFRGVELGISVTSVVFVNPKTANDYLMDSLQPVVIFPRSEKRTVTSGHDSNMLKKTIVPSDSNGSARKPNQIVVCLLFSEDVSEGHIIISPQLRTFLAVDLHSWVFLKCYNESPLSDISSISLSPCQFNTSNDDQNLDAEIQRTKADTTRPDIKKDTFNDTFDLSILEEFVSHLPFASSNQLDEESTTNPQYMSRLLMLLRAWFSSQLSVIESNYGVQTNSLVLGSQTLLHFEVKGFELNQKSKDKELVSGLLMHQNGTGKISVDIFYILTLSSGVSHDGEACGYEFVINSRNGEDDLGSFDVLMEKVKCGDAVSLSSLGQISHNKGFIPAVFPLTWMEENVSLVVNRLAAMLSFESQSWYSDHDVPLTGHILIHGPHGSGKTSLSRAVANVVEQSKNILAHIVFICCSKLASEKAQVMNSAFSGYISEALCHVPSLVVFDDIDSIILAPSDFRGFLPSSADSILSELLCEIMDEYAVKRKLRCGIGPIAFLATARSLENVPNVLRSSGRFDFHVQLPSFSVQQRGAILKCQLGKRSLQCSDDILSAVSSKCDGYDAYDLEILVDRAVHAAVGRFASPCSTSEICDTPILVEDDFLQAMHEFLPISLRDVAKHSSKGTHSGWEDVGGLFEVRNAIKEMIELPSKFPGVYSQAPLRMRSNALLYGPPGCGKTHIVGAAASACSLRFISVRGPVLLNKYIGASEQAVRDIFSKAASAAPCILFFDEFDSIAPSRGHDNTGVTDRVVNQFLTELDGVEALVGVFVFAATSRPDLLDAALLRPGRLDHLLLCDFPSQSERLDILQILSNKVKMEDGVDLQGVAEMTQGYSGADLEAIFSDAQLKVVNDWVADKGATTDPNTCPGITDRLLKSVTSTARRSVSEAERSRLNAIYSRFRDSRTPSTAQICEVKGKRVTLA